MKVEKRLELTDKDSYGCDKHFFVLEKSKNQLIIGADSNVTNKEFLEIAKEHFNPVDVINLNTQEVIHTNNIKG